jgi:hypothetical protein
LGVILFSYLSIFFENKGVKSVVKPTENLPFSYKGDGKPTLGVKKPTPF